MILKKYLNTLQSAISKCGLDEDAFDIYARTEVSKDDITVIRLRDSLLKFELWNTHNSFDTFAINYSEFSPLNKDWAGISTNNLKNNFYWVLEQFESWLENHVKVYLEEKKYSDVEVSERITVKPLSVNFSKAQIDSQSKILFLSRLNEVESYLLYHKSFLIDSVYKEMCEDLGALKSALKGGIMSFRSFYKEVIGITSLWVGEDSLHDSVANGIINFLVNGDRSVFDIESNPFNRETSGEKY